MNIQDIATKQDIESLREELEKIRSIIESRPSERNFLRSADVRILLNISDGTLQRLRISEILPANKVNGTWFYRYEDIANLLKK